MVTYLKNLNENVLINRSLNQTIKWMSDIHLSVHYNFSSTQATIKCQDSVAAWGTHVLSFCNSLVSSWRVTKLTKLKFFSSGKNLYLCQRIGSVFCLVEFIQLKEDKHFLMMLVSMHDQFQNQNFFHKKKQQQKDQHRIVYKKKNLDILSKATL